MLDNLVNKIHCGDCLEIMSEMPDECVDLVVTSPPYGDMYNQMDIHECKNLIQQSIREITRILIPGGKMCVNVNNYITSKSNGWDKRQVIPMTFWVQEAALSLGGLTYQDEIFWIKKLAQGGRGKPLFGSYPYPPNFLMCQRVEYILVWNKDGSREIPPQRKEKSEVTKNEWREWTQNNLEFLTTTIILNTLRHSR